MLEEVQQGTVTSHFCQAKDEVVSQLLFQTLKRGTTLYCCLTVRERMTALRSSLSLWKAKTFSKICRILLQ
jgi:hypothetical protein